MSNKKLQGEGDRESARRFNKDSQKFANSAEGRKSAEKSDHTGNYSHNDLKKAEDEAAKRAKENDPEALRDFSKPAKK